MSKKYGIEKHKKRLALIKLLKMKIAFLIYQYCNYELDDSSAGGVERYVSDLAKMFVDLGHEVHIFCHKIKGTTLTNLQFHHVPAMGFWSPLKIWSFAISSMVLLKKRKSGFDVINSFSKTIFQDVLRLGGGSHLDYMKRTYPMMNHPLFKYLVIANPRHLFNLILEAVIFKFGEFKKIVCISNMCKLEYVRKYNIPEHKISVIYNGVNYDKFIPVNKEESRAELYRRFVNPGMNQGMNGESVCGDRDELLILFAGSGFKRKGLRHVIEALALSGNSSKVRLIIAGRGRIESYMAIAKTHNIVSKITYVGAIDNMQALYDACDIFVFPTNYDAFGNVCLEAMSMELPVIVSKSAGSAEVIDDGINGFVIDYPLKARDIADRIELLIDKQKRITMGKLAREKALNYTVKLNADKTLQLYSETL